MTKETKTSSGGKTIPESTKCGGSGARDILRFQNQNIVVDTISHFVFLGKLEDISDYFITLRDTDVHDRRESPSINEKYILESKKYGIRINRKLVHIRLQEVISISLLDDVIEY